MALDPQIVRRDKSSKHVRQPGEIYQGIVTSARDDGNVYVKIPSLSITSGPVMPLNSSPSNRLSVGDVVACSFNNSYNSSLVVFGKAIQSADDYSISRYANTAERDSLITSPQEGRIIYVLDINEVQVYDGSEWGSIAVNKQYKVGDTGPGGGIVFFVDRYSEYSDFTYLEAAPSSVEVARAWAPGSPVNYRYTEVDGADRKSLGGGYQNTIDIVNQGHTNPATSAAKYCADLSYGGQTDWYLPSIGELQLMCQELHVNRDSGSFVPTSSDYVYWSSTETDASGAFAMSFIDWLNLYPSTKGPGTYQVRPIRRF